MAAEARIGSISGPSANQVSCPRGRPRRRTRTGTASSSNRRGTRSDSTTRRRFSLPWMASPRRASWNVGAGGRWGAPSSASDIQRSRMRSTIASDGSAAMAAPFSAPTEQPTTRSGRMSRSTSACSIPTCSAPRLPPPLSTKAVRGGRRRIRSRSGRRMAGRGYRPTCGRADPGATCIGRGAGPTSPAATGVSDPNPGVRRRGPGRRGSAGSAGASPSAPGRPTDRTKAANSSGCVRWAPWSLPSKRTSSHRGACRASSIAARVVGPGTRSRTRYVTGG